MAFSGIYGAVSSFADADTADLRQALLDAARTLLRTRLRRQPPVTVTVAQARTSGVR